MTMPTAGRDDGPAGRPGGRSRRTRRLLGPVLAAVVASTTVLVVVLTEAPGATASVRDDAALVPAHVKPETTSPRPAGGAIAVGPGSAAVAGSGGAIAVAAPVTTRPVTPTTTRPVVPATTAPVTAAPTSAPAVPLPAPGETWIAELAMDGGDDVNVVATAGAVRLADGVVRAQSARSPNIQGELLLAPRRLAAPIDRVAATTTADVPPGAQVLVDIRGIRSDGTWSQWTPADPNGPAQLPEVTMEIQIRVTLVAGQFGAGPALQRLLLVSDRTSELPSYPVPGTTPTTGVPTTSAPGTSPTTALPTTALPTTALPTATGLPTTTTGLPTTSAPVTTTPPAPTTALPPTTVLPTPTSGLPATTTPGTTTPGTTAAPTTSTTAPAPTTTTPVVTPPLTSRIFATRIGLVGNSTANGHVIVPRDHFVALPSRRGLAPAGTGDYTVKVCADNQRCAWAPVWDVGPWNITDDYWNTADLRQAWRDLAQGLPEAQAAFQQKYNGGRDGFGRTVGNPAGIDLADGTYYDDLQLKDNSWVTVSYLWTGRAASGTALPANAPSLPVRSEATDASAEVGAVGAKAHVAIECTATGQSRTNSQGTSDQWLRIGPNQYIPAAAVEAPSVASC